MSVPLQNCEWPVAGSRTSSPVPSLSNFDEEWLDLQQYTHSTDTTKDIGLVCDDLGVISQPESSFVSDLCRTRTDVVLNRTVELDLEMDATLARVQCDLRGFTECYDRAHASIEKLLSGLSSLDQPLQSNPAVCFARQSIATEKELLAEKLRAVQEARLRFANLRAMRFQRHELDQAFERETKAPRFERNPEAHTDDDSKSDVSDTSLDVPAVVEQYFEAARDAFLEDERLTELDDVYPEKAASTQNQTDVRIATASSPRSDCTYTQERQEICGRLAIAHYRMHARREACVAQGFDPEQFRYRRLSSHDRQKL